MKILLKGDRGIITEISEEEKRYVKKFVGRRGERGEILNLFEILFLLKKGIVILEDGKNLEEFEKWLVEKYGSDVLKKFEIFEYIIERGYFVGSGYKFGGMLRIYDKGIDPNKKRIHSKWICYIASPDEKFPLYDFSAKNRVAHSTKKRLLIAIPNGNDKVFIEVKWKRL